MISAKIIKDSVNIHGCRITTFILEYPRFIHSEMMTHRMFSRNSASSRAIPIQKMIQDVIDNPAEPVHWGKNQKGMQAYEEISREDAEKARELWLQARDLAIDQVRKLHDIGIHKQVCNRLLEPFVNMRVLLTATEFNNFFKLRAHHAAQPEIRELAYKMLHEYKTNTPENLLIGDWHIPFSEKMPEGIESDLKLKIATARAARVSYNTFDGEINIEKDVDLYERLLSEGHLSPFEHCALCCYGNTRFDNFYGWMSYRKLKEEIYTK
jgi:thymidylate synthase ThyX